MTNILVTGGSGFIGTKVAEYWLNKGANVFIIDKKPLPRFLKKYGENIKLIQSDIGNKKAYYGATCKFNKAYHLAAQTSSLISEENPSEDISSNVYGTLMFCNWARENKPDHVIFSSSMAVYGRCGSDLYEDRQLAPCSLYGITKTTGELMIKRLADDNINVTIFRLFNVFGPGQDYSNLKQGMASIFLAQALKAKRIQITGSLDRFRDFIYVSDVISAMTLDKSSLKFDTYNVGTGISTTVSELVTKIRFALYEKACIDIEVEEIAGHYGDTFGSSASIERLLSTGWKPVISLDRGLSLAVEDALNYADHAI